MIHEHNLSVKNQDKGLLTNPCHFIFIKHNINQVEELQSNLIHDFTMHLSQKNAKM